MSNVVVEIKLLSITSKDRGKRPKFVPGFMFALNDKARDIFLFLILHIITMEIQRQRILKKLSGAQYKEQSNKVYEVIIVEDKRIFRLLEYYKTANQLEYSFLAHHLFFQKTDRFVSNNTRRTL